MASYNSFSRVYDLFMSDTPYDEWLKYIQEIWKRNGQSPKMVLDLGCGTGNMTQALSDMGFEMIGVDLSEEMLSVARGKDTEGKILYLNQDMTEFELYGTVDSIICLCDSINYILEYEELVEVFKLVNNYLEPKGIFIFDINTPYKFREILGDNSFSQTTEDAAYTWENFYSEEEKINEFYTNFFIKDENGKYDRFEEYHYERAYETKEVLRAMEEAGLELVGVYDYLSFDKPREDSERIYFVAKENGK